MYTGTFFLTRTLLALACTYMHTQAGRCSLCGHRFICVILHIHVCACLYIYGSVFSLYGRMQACSYAGLRILIRICIFFVHSLCIGLCRCTYSYAHLYIYVYIYSLAFAYIFMYACFHMHIFVHTHMYKLALPSRWNTALLFPRAGQARLASL